LKQRLKVAPLCSGGFALNFRQEVPQDKLPCRIESAVEINGRNQGLEHVRQKIGGNGGMHIHSLSEEKKNAEVELAADSGTGPPAYNGRFDLGQIAFLVIGEALEKVFAHNQAEDRVAQEFQSFVRGEPGVRSRCVSKRSAQELWLPKTVLSRFLA